MSTALDIRVRSTPESKRFRRHPLTPPRLPVPPVARIPRAAKGIAGSPARFKTCSSPILALAGRRVRSNPPHRLVTISKLRIAAATEADIPLILELIRALADYEKLSHAVTATEERIREMLFGVKPAAEVLLAYGEQECAGFAVFFPIYSTFLAQPGIYVEDLYVKPHLRGRGIGLALFRRLAEIAAERCCGRLDWAVLNWNEPAIRFYRKLGAVPLEEWTTYRLAGAELERLARSASS